MPLSIPIIISGKDDLGRTFKETTRTVEVSKNGAKIATSHRLALHADIAVANPTVGSTCLAKVTWRGPRRGKEPIEIGLELLESYQPERIWGLESPPDDWLRAGPTPTIDQRLQYLIARDRTRPADFASGMRTEIPEVLPLPIPAGSPSVPPAAKEVKKRQPTNGEVHDMTPAEVKEALRQVAEAIAPLVQPDLEKSAEESAARITSRLSLDLEERVQAVSRTAEEAVNSLRSAADGATARLEILETGFANRTQEYQQELMKTAASEAEELRRASEALLGDFHTRLASALEGLSNGEAQKAGDQLRQMLADSQARSQEGLESAARAVTEHVAAELRASGTEIVESARNELAGLKLATLRSVTEEVHAAAEGDRARLEQMFDEHARRAAEGAHLSLDSVSLAKDQTLAEFEAARAGAENSLAARWSEVEQRLAQVAAGGVAELEGKSSALLDGFEARLQSTLEAFQERGTEEVAGQLQKIAAELQQRSAAYLEEQASATVEQLRQQLETSGAAVVDETEQRLAAVRQALADHVTKAAGTAAEECRAKLVETFEERARTVQGSAEQAVASIHSAAEERLAGLEKSRAEAQANLEANAVRQEQRLAEVAGRGSEELDRRSAALVEGFQGQLQGTLEAFQEKGSEEVASRLQKIAAELQQHSATYLEQQAAATIERLSAELEASGTKVAEETHAQLAGVAKDGLESLTGEARTISSRAHEAVGAIETAAGAAVAGIEAVQQKITTGFELQVRERQAQIAALAASGAEGLSQRSEILQAELAGQGAQLAERLKAESATALESAATAAGSVECAAQAAAAGLEASRRGTAETLEAAARAHEQRLTELAASREQGIECKSEEVIQELDRRQAGIAQTFDALAEDVSARADSAIGGISAAAGQAMTKLKATQQSLAAGLEGLADGRQKKLESVLASGLEGLEQKSNALTEGFRAQLAQTLHDFEQKGTGQVLDQLQKLVAAEEERWGREVEKRTLAMLAKLNDELAGSRIAMLEEAKRELASATQMSLESVTWATANECRSQLEHIFREQRGMVSGAADEAAKSIAVVAEQTLAKLQTVEQRMEVDFETSADGHQKQLADLAASGAQTLERTADGLVQRFGGQLEQRLVGFQHQAGRDLEAALQRIASTLREQSARELRAQAEETERKLKEGLTASGTGVVEEARRLAGITRESLETLSQSAAEECRRRLNEFTAKSSAIYKQMEDLAESNVEELEGQAASEPRPSRRGLYGLAALVLLLVVPALTGVYMSTRPVMRLRSNPPADFADNNSAWNAKRRAVEQQVARAYWDAAARSVETIYRYGSDLPAAPNAAFKVDNDALAASGFKIDAAATRARYWQKLHDEWGRPQAWEEADGWHTDWIDSLSIYLQESAIKLRWNLTSRLPT